MNKHASKSIAPQASFSFCAYPFTLSLTLTGMRYVLPIFFHTAHALLQSSSFCKYDKSAQRYAHQTFPRQSCYVFFFSFAVRLNFNQSKVHAQGLGEKPVRTKGIETTGENGERVLDVLEYFDYKILLCFDSTLIAQKLVAAVFFTLFNSISYAHTQTPTASTHNHISLHSHAREADRR